MIDLTSKNTQLVSSRPYDDFEIALVMKLTFSIHSNGKCVPSNEQIPIVPDWVLYDDPPSPLVSPPGWDSDLIAFKPDIDIVIQGNAYSYGGPTEMLDVEVQLPNNNKQTIRVTGDRKVDWNNNNPVFTAIKPFERMALRYDKAYGGVDQFSSRTDPTEYLLKELKETEPERNLETGSKYYYPRNPSGRGFLIDSTREALENLDIPNLEFPFDPITIDRLAIGDTKNWLSAPLPASFDWVDPSWFPRIGYLGFTPAWNPLNSKIKEVELGWVDPEILDLTPFRNAKWNPSFQNGGLSGLVAKDIKPNTQMVFKNMFPSDSERKIQLSARAPKVEIQITRGNHVKTTPHLNSIIIRPDYDQVIELWSARAKVNREYTENELLEMNWKANW